MFAFLSPLTPHSRADIDKGEKYGGGVNAAYYN
jgi:hypothetical protein